MSNPWELLYTASSPSGEHHVQLVISSSAARFRLTTSETLLSEYGKGHHARKWDLQGFPTIAVTDSGPISQRMRISSRLVKGPCSLQFHQDPNRFLAEWNSPMSIFKSSCEISRFSTEECSGRGTYKTPFHAEISLFVDMNPIGSPSRLALAALWISPDFLVRARARGKLADAGPKLVESTDERGSSSGASPPWMWSSAMPSPPSDTFLPPLEPLWPGLPPSAPVTQLALSPTSGHQGGECVLVGSEDFPLDACVHWGVVVLSNLEELIPGMRRALKITNLPDYLICRDPNLVNLVTSSTVYVSLRKPDGELVSSTASFTYLGVRKRAVDDRGPIDDDDDDDDDDGGGPRFRKRYRGYMAMMEQVLRSNSELQSTNEKLLSVMGGSIRPHEHTSGAGVVAAMLGWLAKRVVEGDAAVGRDSTGRTLLHYAAESSAQCVLELLVSLGGDLDTPDAEGQSPRDLALMTGMTLSPPAAPAVEEEPIPTLEETRTNGLSMLDGLGFDTAKVMAAMDVADGAVDYAAELLLSGILDDVQHVDESSVLKAVQHLGVVKRQLAQHRSHPKDKGPERLPPGSPSPTPVITLSHNKLTTLPPAFHPDALYSVSVETMLLDHNHFKVVPEAVRELKSLKALWLHFNELVELPEWLGDLTLLRTLFLRNNQIKAIPDSIGQLFRLESLQLDDNQIKALPSLANLSNLEKLSLDRNHISSVPSWIGQLTRLKVFSIAGNAITELPSEITHLKRLQSLCVDDNPQLTSLPWEIGQMYSLRRVLARNCFLHSLPTSIGHLEALEDLDLRFNNLHSLPPEIGTVSSLRVLLLDHNVIKVFPADIRFLALRQFSCASNPLLKETLEEAYVVPSLMDLAGQRVLKSGPPPIIADQPPPLPLELYEYLAEAHLCQICNGPFFKGNQIEIVGVTSIKGNVVPVAQSYCSPACAAKVRGKKHDGKRRYYVK